MKQNKISLPIKKAFSKIYCRGCFKTCSPKNTKKCLLSFIDFVDDYKKELRV